MKRTSKQTCKDRPYVICHMLSSIDGKIDGSYFAARELLPVRAASHKIRDNYHCDAILCDAVTAAEIYGDGFIRLPRENAHRLERTPYLSGDPSEPFAVVVDPKGSVRWPTSRSGQTTPQFIEALTENVSDAYLEHLRDAGISYLFAGQDQFSIGQLLAGLKKHFSIDSLIISGGGIVNWSFLQEGYIDEMSLVISPLVDGRTDTATLFDRSEFAMKDISVAFTLSDVERLDGNGILLKYIPQNRKDEIDDE